MSIENLILNSAAKDHSSAFLLCYDITEPRRLKRIFRQCSTLGTSIQYSVFALPTVSSALEAKSKLADIIDPSADDLRCYRVKPLSQATLIGEPPAPEFVIVTHLPYLHGKLSAKIPDY